MEGGADSQAGSRPENRESVQAGGRAGHHVDRFGGLAQGRARPGSGVRTSGLFGVVLARRPDKCNARQGYLVRP